MSRAAEAPRASAVASAAESGGPGIGPASLLLRVLPLVFLSGACALVQEIAWMRELKLVFGFSTAASASVLGAFSVGLGVGAHVLGRRVDASARPLRFFAICEAAIGAWAAAVPWLLDLVRAAYLGAGGTPAVGLGVGTLLRLGLSLLILGGPAFFMGGTLPALARALEGKGGPARARSAVLYGTNTVGAVLGCLLPTFLVFEALGTRATIWAFACVSLLIAVSANALERRRVELDGPARDRGGPAPAPTSSASDAGVTVAEAPAIPASGAVPPALVGLAAFTSGFCFFFMELVWYRMLAPLFGGTTFTFGLILAVALLAVGAGGLAYGLVSRHLAITLGTFASTCLLEALLLGLPLAAGDHLAIAAEGLRRGAYLGLPGQLAGWLVILAIVVAPGALVAGFQFPLLIALLGRGAARVGRHVGFAYLTNTSGSVVGALLGGFALLPALGAVGSWRLVVVALLIVGVLAAASELRGRVTRRAPWLALGIGALATLTVLATGPTAVWRHGGIGAGRANLPPATASAMRAWLHQIRGAVTEELEGREASIAISAADGVSFIVNGKSDGHAVADAATQIGLGILPALLHPRPQSAFVIGLGTGSTAGWLGAMPSMQRVDVAELEPAIRRVAELCAPVNRDVLANPKVVVTAGDARELLRVSRTQYDLIVSEPSNPFRAGIASLFTREFFAAASARLRPGGLFVQWLQAYEVDGPALGSALATLSVVFPHIELWLGSYGDLFLLGAAAPLQHDVAALRERLRASPLREGFTWAWDVTEVEGVFARFIGGPALARQIAGRGEANINTDDLNGLEYGFARTLGKSAPVELTREALQLGAALGADRPAVTGADRLDLARVAELRHSLLVDHFRRADLAGVVSLGSDPALRARVEALAAARRGQHAEVLRLWQQQPRPPTSPAELLALGYARAASGRIEEAGFDVGLGASLFADLPADRAFAAALDARKKGDLARSSEHLRAALQALRTHPFTSAHLTANLFREVAVVTRQAAGAPPLGSPPGVVRGAASGFDQGPLEATLEALARPFGALRFELQRRGAVLDLIDGTPLWKARCVEALGAFEPWPPWTMPHLVRRLRCHADRGEADAEDAARDLAELRASLLAPLGGVAESSDVPADREAGGAGAPASAGE